MPHSHTKYIDDAEWDCPKKIKSRIETIVVPYRHIYKRLCLPEGRQYWTICGAHFDEQGKLDGEYGQLIKDGLISPHQFYGVDKEKSIIDKNREYYPSVKWLNGDFLEMMEEALIAGDFRPAIINFDNIRQKKFGAKELMQIMKMIDDQWYGDLLLSVNFVLNSPYRKSVIDSGNDVIDCLLSCYKIPDHWNLYPEYYLYHGSGSRSATWMGTFTFVKKEHEESIITEGRRLDQWEK